jgi:hypothetical protein
MALTFSSNSNTVEMARRDDDWDGQKWEVRLVDGDGGAQFYRLTNVEARPSLSLEIGEEEKIVVGAKGVRSLLGF